MGRLSGLFGQQGAAADPPHEAHALAKRMPALMIEAKRVAQTVAYGVHGRRQAGQGETFWQFRHYGQNDAAPLIDWRRSASSDHLYVREREWEAAHTVWLWLDRSPSMRFRSRLSPASKADRAMVLTLAVAELLIQGGERVAAAGLLAPTAQRGAMERLAAGYAKSEDKGADASLPPAVTLNRFSGAVFVSDFLEPPGDIRAAVEAYARQGVRGHMVQVLDPAEETLPYDGRTEFHGPEGGERWIADRAETLRPLYRARLEAHRAALGEIAKRIGWSLLVHHTDRPATEPLLTLIMRLHGEAGGYRWQGHGGNEQAAGSASA
ncbi:MAG: DUF58 domain-containing protein [Hyphomicrobiales bacterium]|nr:DUF58 domain-containing protein [Hyphomicrobiales bacterium]